jgi:hypothetical protein
VDAIADAKTSASFFILLPSGPFCSYVGRL